MPKIFFEEETPKPDEISADSDAAKPAADKSKGAERLKELIRLQRQRSQAMSGLRQETAAPKQEAAAPEQTPEASAPQPAAAPPPQPAAYQQSQAPQVPYGYGAYPPGYPGYPPQGYPAYSGAYAAPPYGQPMYPPQPEQPAAPKRRYSIDDYLENQKQSIMGKKLSKTITDANGNVLAQEGAVVTEELFNDVKSKNKDSIIEMVMYSQ
jgi:hypothetical protein